MIIKPDDQVLDYFLYQKRMIEPRKDVERFLTGYQFWVNQMRSTA